MTRNKSVRQNATAAALFLGLSPASRHLCRDLRWFGSRGDGGYHVCVDSLTPGSCIVYSLGTRENPSFDVAMAAYGCEVHSFDPTLEQQGLKTAALLGKSSFKVTFHDVGIGGRSMAYAPGTAPWQWPGLGYGRESNSKKWTLRTLESLMRELGHAKVDVLKMDVEGAEWPLLEHLLSSGHLRKLLSSGGLIRQIILEIHMLPRPDPSQIGSWPLPELYTRSRTSWFTRTPAYPVPSAADADAFNWHAADLLQQLVHEGGFGLLSHRVNTGGPSFIVSVAPKAASRMGKQHNGPRERKLPCCHEFSFLWKGISG
eukprot:748062-Pleurochrysis_carterae.AAC.1